MKPHHFAVSKRPRLGSIIKHGIVELPAYEAKMKSMQSSLQAIQQAYIGTRERAVVVLEGWDAAGKGGIVRRLGWAMDPRSFRVHPISAPSLQEKGKHYLQRFWEKLPEHGEIVVFDRSWYGRVLVERVEGFAAKREWQRAYEEINQFERLLIEDGIRIVKIFLHISAEEQIRRFEDRMTNPLKRWKLSYEDFRNRDRRTDYEVAIEEMMDKSSTKSAPWYLIPTDNKPFGRLAAFAILIARLGRGVNVNPRPLEPGIVELAARLGLDL